MLWRGRFAFVNPHDKSTGLLSFNSVAAEMAASLLVILVLPILIYRRETRSTRMVNDGTLDKVKRDQALHAQLTDISQDPESSKLDSDVLAEATRAREIVYDP